MRTWILSPLLVCLACSDRGTHSGSLPEPADFLPMAADTAEAAPSPDVQPDTIAQDSSELPRLVLRCEAGRVNAYVVAGGSPPPENQDADSAAVPVLLDSALSC